MNDNNDPTIDNSFDYADRLFDGLCDILDDCEHDPAYVLFGLWTDITRELVCNGWTTEELLREVGRHAADQESEGRA